MKLAPLLTELQPQQNGLRRAQRLQHIGTYLHIITIVCIRSGYRLIRTVASGFTLDLKMAGGHNIIEEQIRDFRSLSDLFVYVKQEGFFEEVAPYAPGWKGYTQLMPKPRMSPVEEERLREEEERFQYEWEIDHPEEVRAEQLIETRWEELGKNEVITYEDEQFDDGGYDFSSTEYDEDDID